MSGVRPIARTRSDEPARAEACFPHVLLAVDGSHVITWAGGEVERLLGYRAEELVGRSADLLFEASAPSAWDISSQACCTKWGAIWKTYRRSAPVYSPEGRAMGSMELLSDALYAREDRTRAQRTQNLELLGSLASGIAHDFNNLLQAIQGHATLALDGVPASFPVHANLDQVLKASARGAELVRRILAFGRPSEARREVVDLCAVVREAVELLRATLPTSIALRSQFAQERLPVLASSTELHQIVVNLALNAVHAIGVGPGAIEICVEALPDVGATETTLSTGPHAVLKVRDDGCGMSDEVRSRIFEPFFTTKGSRGGTGLGLSVVHEIIRSAGGAIDVESALGHGTTFSLFLPRAAESPPSGTRAANGFSHGHGERVLYVDDDPMLVSLGKALLEAIGYRVTSCAGSLEALDLFSRRPDDFDIVLSDVSMPSITGFELARRIRQLRPNVPVLMMSGYVGPDERALADDVGAREILLKPVGMADFGRALARNLRAG